MPAEWEPQESVWLVWPHSEATWPTVGLEAARAFFCDAVRLIGEVEWVDLVVRDPDIRENAESTLRQAGVSVEPVRFHEIVTNDSWVRDFGPTWRVSDNGDRRSAAVWRFNAWGGKYPPWEADDAAGRTIAEIVDARSPAGAGAIEEADFILEGGSIEVDGQGALMTTRQCLLNTNREAGRTESMMNERLTTWLGCNDILWLPEGIAGDDTDGHVDDCARFGETGCVILAIEEDRADANFDPLQQNKDVASAWAGQRGRDVVMLPMPEPVYSVGERLPASYANFLICNGRVIAPTFGKPQDAEAVTVLRRAFPSREVCTINALHAVEGLGAIHCLSQHLPRVGR